jgi:Heparinase II/III-like protein/Heparinase II/III N-terminus
MSWLELATRVRQELDKRLDVSLYRLGLEPHRVGRCEHTSGGNFFFCATELAERVRLLQKHLGLEVRKILDEANEICRHNFCLLGYTGLRYGPEIDWHLDAVHAKRAPLKPWFKIDFLNFAEVGDHKIIWELNRHQHLVTLAKAALLSGENRYVTELVAQWYAWQGKNPYPIGINWASSLEVAFRSLAWIWIRALLIGCPSVPENFDKDIVRGLAVNGRHIEHYLSTYFSPNTHLLGEGTALFFIAVLCPQIPSAPRWREIGLQTLLDQARRQVRPDGVHFEGSLYYHVYALDFFLHVRLLALRNGIEIPASFDQRLQKMLAVVKALSQNGPPDSFGDDDGGRVFNPRRNRAEHMLDPLALGAPLFQDTDLQGLSTLTEESIWLFGAQATAQFRPPPPVKTSPGSESFPDGGIYISANSGNSREQMTISAGFEETGRNGHHHADALSIRFSFQGHRWLIDPGTCCYVSVGHERDLFRGTGAHNTLRVDRVDQAQPAGPFAWSEPPSVRTERWVVGETFTLFSGSHTGYLRLHHPVLHRRFILHLYDRFWMVRDIAEGGGIHELEIFWHFASALTAARVGTSFIASFPGAERNTRLALVLPDSDEWDSELMPGQVSPAYGMTEPAQVLRCSAKLRLPAEHAVILQPVMNEHCAPGHFVFLNAQRSRDIAVYQYKENHRTHTMISAGAKNNSWDFSDWASDAAFFYCCADGQRVSHLIACNVTSVQFRGKQLLYHSQALERFEYLAVESQRKICSSCEESLNSFSEAVLESSKPVL